MRKIISVFLSCAMLFSLCVCFATAEDDLKLTVVTDIHYSASDSTTEITESTAENPWGYVVSNGKMTAESGAIVDEFLKQAAADDSQYLIVTGDNSDTGAEADVAGIVAKLEAFEATSGKTVFALIGNHENGYKVCMSNDKFKEYYKNLGYDKALDIDENSCSYTADLNSKYRLIMIDTNNFNQSRIDWIEAQVKKANEDGKKLISVTHFSIFTHYDIQQLAHDSVVDESWNLADKFIEWGIKFNFSGHTHELDTAVYENDNGKVYDISSGALTTYPACYHTAVFGEKTTDIDTKYITSIDTSLVPGGLQKECSDLLASDFRAYAKRLFIEGAYNEVSNYIYASRLISMLNLNAETDAEIITIINNVVPTLREAILMPLYGENSLSSIAVDYDITIPSSDYSTLLAAAVEIYAAHCAGNENMPIYNSTVKVTLNGLAAALAYALKDLSAEDYEKVITFALNKLGYADKIPAELTKYAADAIARADGIELVLTYAVSPIVEDFSMDAEPDDVKVSLPAYGYSDGVAYTFMAKLIQIFEKILSFFTMIFAIFSK